MREIADTRSTPEYRLTHKRRLEALRRGAEIERGKAAANIRVLSWVSLENLSEAPARTMLDDALEKRGEIETVRAGFGEELRGALAARRR